MKTARPSLSGNLMIGGWSTMEDSVAVQSRPVPIMASPVFPSLVDDPDLGLTPEKPALIHRVHHTHKDTRSKARHKVRFADHNSPDEKCPAKLENSAVNKDKKMAGRLNESVEIINIGSENIHMNDSQLDEDQPQTIRYETTDSVNKYALMIESGEMMQSCIPAFCDPFPGEYGEQQSDFQTDTQYTEHSLARPEFNSTLWMNKELQQLKSQTLDVAAAVEEKLKVSTTTRQKIAEKAYSKLNHHVVDQQYPELISLEVPEDDIVSMAARQQSAKLKLTKKDKTKTSKTAVNDMPDIYDFLTADREKETASFSLDGVSSSKPEFCVAPPLAAFQIYKHIRMWENY